MVACLNQVTSKSNKGAKCKSVELEAEMKAFHEDVFSKMYPRESTRSLAVGTLLDHARDGHTALCKVSCQELQWRSSVLSRRGQMRLQIRGWEFGKLRHLHAARRGSGRKSGEGRHYRTEVWTLRMEQEPSKRESYETSVPQREPTDPNLCRRFREFPWELHGVLKCEPGECVQSFLVRRCLAFDLFIHSTLKGGQDLLTIAYGSICGLGFCGNALSLGATTLSVEIVSLY